MCIDEKKNAQVGMVDNSLPISPLLDKSSFRVQFGFLIKV